MADDFKARHRPAPVGLGIFPTASRFERSRRGCATIRMWRPLKSLLASFGIGSRDEVQCRADEPLRPLAEPPEGHLITTPR